METLITQVAQIDAEAEALVEAAGSEGKTAVDKVISSEEKFLADVKKRAQARGAAIVKERVKKAQDKVNALHQDDAAATAMVHEAAEKNRDQAVKSAISLFEKDYLSA